MNLEELVKKLSRIEYVEIGKGYKHSTSPNLALRDDCNKFFAEYPTLREDKDYVEFMEVYAGAIIDHPNEVIMVDIYGLLSDLTVNVLYPDESLIEKKKFFRFGEVAYVPIDSKRKDGLSASFAFDLTDASSGIYKRREIYQTDYKTVPYEWYCASFIEWFEKLVMTSGKLID